LESLERWKAEMPTEQEMLPKDKYTIFDRKEKRYRKGIHSMLQPVENLCGIMGAGGSTALARYANPIAFLQSCRSGPGFRKELTRPVTRWLVIHVFKLYKYLAFAVAEDLAY
jgi:hypothetical protein